MFTARRSLTAVVAGLVLTMGLTGCSKEVNNGTIAKTLKSKLQEAAPDHKYGKVECHDNLNAKVGAKTDCDIVVDGTTQKFDAKVTRVEGKKVYYDFVKG